LLEILVAYAIDGAFNTAPQLELCVYLFVAQTLAALLCPQTPELVHRVRKTVHKTHVIDSRQGLRDGRKAHPWPVFRHGK
jgi:hypothetical protein